jgi:mannose/fructose/N-acetylgalactosamine-specific phosphotransferase system component IIB
MAIKIIGSTIIDDSRNIVNAGIATVTSVSIGNTQVVSSARQLQNIASLDATTTATIESAIANAPNTFTSLNVTGISTLGVTSTTNLTAQQLNVSGLSTFAGITTYTTSLFGTQASFSGVVTALNFSGNASSATYSASSGIATYATSSGIATYSTSAGIATYATSAGIATYATTAGVSTSVIGGIGSITQLQVTGISTFTNGPVFIGATSATGTASQPLQVTGGAYVSGSVGIGTTNPEKPLHLLTSIATPLIIQRTATNNSAAEYRNSTSSMWAGLAGNANGWGVGASANLGTDAQILVTRTGGELLVGRLSATGTSSQKLQVESGAYVSGSVGIGTTNPGTGVQLDVVSTTNESIRARNSAIPSGYLFFGVSSSDYGRIGYYNGAWKNIAINEGGGNVLIGATSETGTASQRLQVSGGAYVSGNLGVGATNPSQKLDVVGNVRASGTAAPSFIVTPTSGSSYIFGANTVIGGGGIYDNTSGFWRLVVKDTTGNIGINSTLPTSRLDVIGDAKVSGVVTATTFIGALTGTATTATKLATPRTFEITGDVVASAISFDGTGNVSLAATIQPNSVALGSDTTGDYVANITGTSNQITVTSGTGEGSTPTLSLPSNLVVPQDLTVTRDLQVNRNLNVTGNITIGGTSAFIDVQELRVFDPDIILGFRTDAFGNDASNDNTANHGGVAVASTEGSPLVQLFIAGIETAPATYKKIMWFKSGTFSGLGTDAWLSNYAVGIGSTQFPTGTRLAAGSVQFTENDLAVVRNINASGVGTIPTLSGTTATYTTGNFTTGNIVTGVVTTLSGTTATYNTGNFTNGNIVTGVVTTLSGTTATYNTGNFTNGNIVTGVVTTLSGTTATYNTGNFTNGNIVTGVVTTLSGTTATYNTGNFTTGNVVTGVVTTLTSTNATLTNINSSGISTLGITTFTGAVSFGTSAFFGDNDKIILGDTGSFEIYKAAADSVISETGSGALYLASNGPGVYVSNGYTTTYLARFLTGAAAELYFNNVKEFETTGYGATVFGTLQAQGLQVTGISTFTQISAGGTTGPNQYVLSSTGTGLSWQPVTAVGGGTLSGIVIQDEGSIVGTAGSITTLNFVGTNVAASAVSLGNTATITVSDTPNFTSLNVSGVSTFAGITTVTGTTLFAKQLNVSGVSTFGGNVFLGDNDILNFGDSNDLQIYHNGSNSYIDDNGTGNLVIRGTSQIVFQSIAGEDYARFNNNGAVELYYDNSKKFETISTGVTVTNDLYTSGNVSVAGTIFENFNGQLWNVVTQADVGYGASQVPLNQYLGQLAFLDDFSPNGLRRDGGGSDDVTVNDNGFVGIGTTNATATLDVRGNFNITGVSTVGFLTATGIWNSGITTSSRLTLNGANDTATGGGQLYLNGATGNRIDFNTNGSAAPAFTTRSAGTKIVLYPGISGSSADHAFGIEGNTSWYSIPTATSTQQHRWYAGTTALADLKGSGELVIGSTSLTGTASQRLQVTGGAYVSGNLGIGSTSPTSRLDVIGDAKILGVSTFTAANTSAIVVRSGASGSYTTIDIGRTASEGFLAVASSAGVAANDAVAGDIVFRANGASNKLLFNRGATNASLAIDGSNVLVGTVSSTGTASQRLQVTGGAYVSGVGVATGSIGVGITNPQGTIDIRTSPQWSAFNQGANLILGGSRNNALGILDSNNSNPWAIINGAGTLNFYTMPSLGDTVSTPTSITILNIQRNGNILIGAASSTGTASQRLQVTGGAYVSGDVGIGRTTPGVSLDVNGGIRARGGSPGANGVNNNGYAFGGTGDTDAGMFSSADNQLEFYTNNAERLRINGSNILINTTSVTGTASQNLQVTGGAYVSGSVGIGTTNPSYKLHVVGSFGATTKSFIIDHPTKEGKKLQYGSLESPYHGIRLTGSSTIENGKCVVELPDYIHNLVQEEGINIHITNIKHGKILWVEEVNVAENNFIVMTEETNGEYEFYWDFTAIRKDVEDMIVEF